MKSFREYITEAISADKNLRISHLEDLLVSGQDGIRDTILILNNLIRQAAGVSTKDLQVKVKYDGSPSLVVGIDPETKKFFVGTKSVFNKINPKINYTPEDIDRNHPEPELNKKLKVALQYLPELGIKNILQGDLMFIQSTLKRKEVDGLDCVTFQPNTLTYVVPVDSPLGKEILRAKIGIVFHTQYDGDSIPTLKATLNVNLSSLKKTPNIWFRDADFENVGKKAALDPVDVKKLTEKYNLIREMSKRIDSTLFDKFESDKDFRDFILGYTNFLVRKGGLTESPDKKYLDFIQYTKDKFSGEESVLKTNTGKEKKGKKLDYMLDILDSYKASLIKFFELQNEVINAKMMIVNSLNKLKGMGTYIDKGGQLTPTNPEGFVAVGNQGTVKLIDRGTFSKQNFENPRNKKPEMKDG